MKSVEESKLEESVLTPKEAHEEWSNNEYTNILDFLSERKVPFNGRVFLEWVAAPYISIWMTRHTKIDGAKFWIMHNKHFTDIILSNQFETPRDAIIAFSEKWSSGDREYLRVRESSLEDEEVIALLERHAKMLNGVGFDEELWETI